MMNLCTPNNTLKTRVRDFYNKVMALELARELVKKELEKALEDKMALERSLKVMAETVVSETELETTKTTLELATEKVESLKAKKAGLFKLEEYKFSYTSDADRALKKEWKKAETDMDRCNAIVHWLNAYGITCLEEDWEVLKLARKLDKFSKNKKDDVILNGEHMLKGLDTSGSLSLRNLYEYMTDKHFDAGLMSAAAVPEELKDIYKARVELAKAKRAAKKAKKNNK